MIRELKRFTGGLPAVLTVAAFAAACSDPSGEPNARIQQVLSSGDSPVLELPGGDTLHLSEPVVAFYEERGYRQAWTDYDEVLDRGTALLETMGSAERDGLDPERYRHGLAERMLLEVEEDSLEESEEPGQMGELDLVLSEVFGRYANHLSGGTVNPDEAGLDWRIERGSAPVGELLRRMANGIDPERLLADTRPAAPEYERLMEGLARYRQIQDNGGWPEVPASAAVDVGESAPAVAALRRRLIAERDPDEVELARAGEAEAATFDEDLASALEHFQRRHGMRPDGRVGELTLAELNTPVEQRILDIKLNMDRWRWLPRELGERYVLVNVAGFEMELVERDSVIMAMNVVVGKQAWSTPIFRDTMEHIVVNPYWNVPQSIEADEIIPAVRRDPGYIARNNFEVLRGGNVVDPYAINWNAFGGGNSPYQFRQKPGGSNALGWVKFLFPNDDNIYLHDTPADNLFSESSRAFSHGCIRVERPFDLARILFEKVTDQPPERFDELRGQEGEQWVPLTEPLPVYILYFTAWADRNGTVRFYPDVYERDKILESQTERRLASLPVR